MINRGSLLVYGILAVATAAGIVTLIFTWSRGNQALQYWGTESAFEIRHAQTVELWTIQQVEDPAAWDLSHGLKKWKKTERIDISNADGLTHMRQALIEDASYQWHETDTSCTTGWKHALVFTGKKDLIETITTRSVSEEEVKNNEPPRQKDTKKSEAVTILIGLNCGQVTQQGNPRTLIASSILKAGLQTWIDEQLNTGAGQ